MSKVFPPIKYSNGAVIPINTSMCFTGDEDKNSGKGEQFPLAAGGMKYLNVWKRAKNKILKNIRIQKMIANAKNLGLEEGKDRKDTSLNTVDIEKFLLRKRKALDDDEENERQKGCCRTFRPDCSLRKAWDRYISIWLIYSCIVTPFSVAFLDVQVGDAIFIFDFIVDISFLFDLIFNFITGYYDKEGVVHLKRLEIVKHYLITWFIIDLLAAFPSDIFELILEGAYGSSNSKASNIAKAIKMRNATRMFKIARSVKFFKYTESQSFAATIQNFLKITHNTKRLISTILVIMICIHIFSCFFYYSAKMDNFSPNTWVVREGYADSDNGTIYLTCVYYSLTTLTTIGYGDITPRTNEEKLLVMVWMIAAVYFLSFVISSLSSTLAQNDVRRALIDQKYSLLDNFVEESGIDQATKKAMQNEIKSKILRSAYSSQHKEEIIQDFSTNLKYSVANSMYGGVISQFEFFKLKDKVFISSIFPLLEAQYFSESQTVYAENDISDMIYFISRGRVRFIFGEEEKSFKVINVGDSFGDIEVTKNIRRLFSVVSYSDSFILAMNQRIIKKIKKKFPKVWKELKFEAVKKERNIIKSLAEMKVLIRINFDGKIGSIKSKDVKEAVCKEIEMIQGEVDSKHEENEEGVLAKVIKNEMQLMRNEIVKLEARIAELEKVKKRNRCKKKIKVPDFKS